MSAHRLPIWLWAENAGCHIFLAGNMVKDLAGRKNGLSLDPLPLWNAIACIPDPPTKKLGQLSNISGML